MQQGMNPDSRTARRYHWLSGDLDDFVCEPHAAVCCDQRAPTLNLVAGEADTCRKTIASIAAESPEKILREAHGIRRYQALASLRDPARFSYAEERTDSPIRWTGRPTADPSTCCAVRCAPPGAATTTASGH